MTVACPVPEWPRDLMNAGPSEDRSILLRGEATIGAARFVVTAVRVDPIQFGPDFRPDVHVDVYREYHLPTLLDVLSELMDIDNAATLQLETGSYLIWMLPAGARH
jgi:hypothetical protein